MNTTSRTPVFVLGAGLAGLAGLTAALHLARAGQKVVIRESRNRIGGLATTDHKDGFDLNQGPHAIYLGGPTDTILRQLGVALHGQTPPTTSARIVMNGSLQLAPGSASTLLRSHALPTREKPTIAMLLARLPRLRSVEFAGLSTSDWIDNAVTGSASRALIHTLARIVTYSAIPEQLSAQIFIEQMQLALGKGVLYLDGGWGTIIEQLATALRNTGLVTFELGQPTDELPDAAAVIVATGSASRASQLLGHSFAVGPAAHVSCLDLGVRKRPTHDVVFSADESLYFSNHSAAAKLAPTGSWLVSAAQYLGMNDSPELAALRRLVALAGVTDEDVVMQRHLHRMTAVSSLATAETGGLAGRPSIHAPGHRNVFLAGDWVGPVGHLADASVASAKAAAAAVLVELSTARAA